jgi:hypothetical protein
MIEDFPKTLLELERRFSSEEACVELPRRSPLAGWLGVPAV